jgi:multidrug efflux pump subunit AcrB
MNVTRFALTKRTVMTVLLVLALVAGAATYFTLPRQEDPGFTVRTALVTAHYPGATPQEVEQLVTDPLEEEIEEISRIEFVESESRSGASVIQVEVQDQYSDIEPIWVNLRERVQAAAPRLPEGVIGPTVHDNYGDRYSTVVAMTGEGLSYPELEAIGEEVKKTLLGLKNVGKVQLQGLPQKRVFVELDRARLASLGLSASQLAGILKSRNAVVDGGYVETDRERIEMRPTGTFESVEQIRAMTFRLPESGELVALRDVATVRRGTADPPVRNVSYNGRRAVSIAVSMADGGKITQLGPRILDALDEMEGTLPAGIEFHTVSYRASVVDSLVNEFSASLLQGILAVLAVMLLFLGARTGTIVAAAIPMTIIGSLLFMAVFDISLNKMSLTALIIALGLLVDNAIVISESILVQMREGKRAFRAALDSVKELRFPLLVASLTTSAALLPTYLNDHVIGEYTSAIFEVVTIALLLSWGVSLTVMPMLCSLFLQVEGDADDEASGIEWWKPTTWPLFSGGAGSSSEAGRSGGAPAAGASAAGAAAAEATATGTAKEAPANGVPPNGSASDSDPPADRGTYDTPFYRWYRGLLASIIRRRWVALGTAAALLGTALWASSFLPEQFIPRKEETIFKGEVEMPYGTPFERTRAVVQDLEAFMRDSLQVGVPEGQTSLRAVPKIGETTYDEEGIVNWGAWIGSGAPRYILGYNPEQPRPNYAYFLVNTTSFEVQSRVLDRMNAFLERNYPEATPRLEKLRNGPPIDYPVEIRVSGPNRSTLQGIVADLKTRMRRMDGLTNIGDDWGQRQKRLRVDIDDARAQRAGLTTRDVGLSLRTGLTGVPLTNYRDGNDLVPVMMRTDEARQRSVASLQGVDVYSQSTGRSVPLTQVADLSVGFQPSKILRRDRKRTVTVQADIAPDAPGAVTPFSVVERLRPWLETQSETWPFGYTYGVGGEPEQSGDARGGIADKAPYAVLFIILLLVTQFNSVRKPLIVVLTLPFALIGVVSGLLMTNLPFDFMGILGVIALFGIVINNAVVLIDRIEIEIEDFGRSEAEAVLQASQRRLRPILLTTATTVCGLVPLWVSGDVMFTPMAVAMIFGLLASTVLTLGLVPLLYALFFGVEVSPRAVAAAGGGSPPTAASAGLEDAGPEDAGSEDARPSAPASEEARPGGTGSGGSDPGGSGSGDSGSGEGDGGSAPVPAAPDGR